MWFTYLLLCKDRSIYTGITNNLEQRLDHHREGKGGHYTRSHKAVRILYSEKFKTRSEALKREAEIKGWKKEKKLSLIRFKKT
jgi:putative endonuclease